MGSQNAVILRFEDLRSLAFGGISGVYAGVGTGSTNAIRMIKVTNLTDATLLISFNGIDDKDVIAASSAFIYDYGSNTSIQGGALEQPSGTRIFVKQASGAATSGTVYVTIIYVSVS